MKVLVFRLIFIAVFSSHQGTLIQGGLTSASEPQILSLEPDFASPIENVTVALGREAKLSCIVDHLGENKVGWMKVNTQTILSIHQRVVTHNTRVSVSHDEPRTWNLHIRLVQEDDRGCYMCQINTSSMKKTTGCVDVHVPPDIIDSESSNDVKATEGGDVSLRCVAKGYPEPSIVWKREDGEKIIIRRGRKEKTKVEEVHGPILNLTRVNKRHMGAYQCIANNGVPPAVVKRIEVDVHFAPSIDVPNQLVGAPLGSHMELRCLVEASPKPITYWEREEPREIIMNSSKYRVSEDRTSYKTTMNLLVQNLTAEDFGLYLCTARNSIDDEEDQIRTYKIATPPTRPPSSKSRGSSNLNQRGRYSEPRLPSEKNKDSVRSSPMDHSVSSGYKKNKRKKKLLSSNVEGVSFNDEDRQRERTYLQLNPSYESDSSAAMAPPRFNYKTSLFILVAFFLF